MKQFRSAACILSAVLGSGCISALAQETAVNAGSGKSAKSKPPRSSAKATPASPSRKSATDSKVKPWRHSYGSGGSRYAGGSIRLDVAPGSATLQFSAGAVAQNSATNGASTRAGAPAAASPLRPPSPATADIAGEAPPTSDPRSLGAIGKRKVSLETERAEPWDAILNLLRDAGVNYVIGGEAVGGRKVTARFRSVPLEEALDALAEAAGLNYKMQRGIIILTGTEPVLATNFNNYSNNAGFPDNSGYRLPSGFMTNGGFTSSPFGQSFNPPQPTTVSPTLPGAPGQNPEPEQVDVIPISNRPAEQMMELIPISMPQLSSLTFIRPDTRNNTLIIAGPREAVAATREIVRMLDVRQSVLFKLHFFEKAGALPEDWFKGPVQKSAPADPSTRVTILSEGEGVEALVKRVQDSGGRLYSNPVIVTENEIPAELTISRGSGLKPPSTSEQDVQANQVSNAFKVILVPTVNSDDTITLNLSFTEPNADQTLTKSTPQEERPLSGDSPSGGPIVLSRRVRQNQVLALMRPRRAEGGKSGEGYLLLVSARLENQPTASYGYSSLTPSPAAPAASR